MFLSFVFHKKTEVWFVGIFSGLLSWVVWVGINKYEYDEKVEKHCFWENLYFIRSCKFNLKYIWGFIIIIFYNLVMFVIIYLNSSLIWILCFVFCFCTYLLMFLTSVDDFPFCYGACGFCDHFLLFCFWDVVLCVFVWFIMIVLLKVYPCQNKMIMIV